MTLEFQSHYGGSGKATTDAGAYYVIPVLNGWRPRFSDGAAWTWSGAVCADQASAEAACQQHHDDI